MKACPESIGGARVVCHTPIDHRHRFTGGCKQIVRSELTGPMAGLAICQYAGQNAFYLFGCDAGWQNVTDTWHQTLTDAQHQAEFEYEGVSKTWVFAEPDAAQNGGPATPLGNPGITEAPPSVS
ncbi:MAG: hypothetical protein HYY24_29155 [Verrucomicrobia bacterium]|nr:hypothetical protein [Verrucomicrobiota bacterium]